MNYWKGDKKIQGFFSDYCPKLVCVGVGGWKGGGVVCGGCGGVEFAFWFEKRYYFPGDSVLRN